MEATAKWRLVEREGGLFVEDEGGVVIADAELEVVEHFSNYAIAVRE